jgi:3-oxoacyl-[acyl-carrier-protein] synthase-3
VSPDHASPSAACFVQRNLGLAAVPAFDLTASCSGFVYALDLAARSVVTGADRVLAIAADIRSRFVDVQDRATAPLFGDGACAAVLSRGPAGTGLVSIGLQADGAGVHSVFVPAGGSRQPATAQTVENRSHFIRMAEGPQVYLTAVEGMLDTGEALLQAEGLSWKDVRWVVPHQPNRRILERIARLARLDEDQLVIHIEKVGNISGASCGVALHHLLRSEQGKPGDRVLLLAAGAGYTAGAALLVLDDTAVRCGG